EATEAAVAQLEATAATMRQVASEVEAEAHDQVHAPEHVEHEPHPEQALHDRSAEQHRDVAVDLDVLELKLDQETRPASAEEPVDLEPVKRALLELNAAPPVEALPPPSPHEPSYEEPASAEETSFASILKDLPAP